MGSDECRNYRVCPDRFLFIQKLKHPQIKLRAFSNSPFCGLLKNIQKTLCLSKIDQDIHKIVQIREMQKSKKCGVLRG